MARRTKAVRFTGNAGDGGVLGTIKSANGFTDFTVHTITGSVRFIPALIEGVFDATPLVLSQEPAIVAETPEIEGTFTVNTSTSQMAFFEGDFAEIQVIQEGAVDTDVIIRLGGDG
jgi:hypothetical protein